MYKCKFCGHEYKYVYDNLTPMCCKKAFYSKGLEALEEVKKEKKKK